MLALSPTVTDPKVELEIELEQLFNKNQLIRRVTTEFETDPTIVKMLDAIDADNDFLVSLLVQMVLHKRTTLPTLVGILRRHFETGPNASANPCQAATAALETAARADLVDWDPTIQQFIIRYDISDDVKRELELFQFPLPMVVMPELIESNRGTPYLSLSDGSVILRKNHHEDDICLDHINRVNQIRFTLDMDTAAMIQNVWRNIDKAKAGESKKDFDKRKRAFEKYDRTARDIMSVLVDNGNNEFYLTHKYDKRGRIYCQGYHVNYQGAPWNKAVVQLADKEMVT